MEAMRIEVDEISIEPSQGQNCGTDLVEKSVSEVVEMHLSDCGQRAAAFYEGLNGKEIGQAYFFW
jgi:hypothetical protein